MALRVLLADDSPNIKKVVNLALQSFGVEVKSVPSGEDVIPVAHSFRPDIVISDIMLAKIDGYEICRLIKMDPTLKKTPVVLMWSNFMQLDEDRARECGADARLEKPFEQEELRSIIQTFVQKTKSNPLSEFLQFPEITPQSFAVPTLNPATTPQAKKQPPQQVPPLVKQKPTLAAAPTFEDEDSDQFARTDLKFNQTTPEISPLASSNLNDSDENEPWTETNLDRFKIANHTTAANSLTGHNFTNHTSHADHGLDSLPEIDVDIPDVDLSLDEMDLTASSPSPLDAKQIENLVQAQIESKIQASIDAAIWKILPEIAERVIREELNKLLKDIEL